MVGRNEIIAHTADIRMRVSSDSLRGLFLVSLQGLNQLLAGSSSSPERSMDIKREIRLQADNPTTLLIDFLSEVLTLSHIEKAVFYDFSIDTLTENLLSGTLKGIRMGAFREDVKAVTYHEADVKLDKRGDWSTLIVFDV